MQESLRQKKVSSLLKEELSRHIQRILSDPTSLITITRINMTKDLKTAHVFLSFFGNKKTDDYLDVLNRNTGVLRKSVATKIKLKYNPLLIFSLDPAFDPDDRVSKILKNLEKNERGQYKKDR